MNKKLEEKLTLACRIARSYFDRGMGSGTTGNLSFMHEGVLYITASGTCFGFLTPADFAAVPFGDGVANHSKTDAEAFNNSLPVQLKPSKELPLHEAVYKKLAAKGQPEGAVIHTHSTYSVLWSCMEGLDPKDAVPDIIPYLRMKLGSCGLISYHKPGTDELFKAFETESGDLDGWLFAHHGLLVGGKDLMQAFGRSEELEETCKIAWMLKGAGRL
jgi:ribulose-5-phosphate 4-epimerase/fuculose-1-phosphate aldolase